MGFNFLVDVFTMTEICYTNEYFVVLMGTLPTKTTKCSLLMNEGNLFYFIDFQYRPRKRQLWRMASENDKGKI